MSIPRFNVVLYQPEIPQNTGNIGRTCVALQAKLWIVRPTGFLLGAKQLKRAFFTKFATASYSDAMFQQGDWLVFGSESSGLPDSIRTQYGAQCLALPMIGPVRSLNLAVAVGVGLFEAHRQTMK